MRTRANILVRGAQPALDAFIEEIRPVLREPIAVLACGPDISFDVPAPTLILRDVDRLDDDGQRALYAWVRDERSSDTQIVALSTRSVFSLVEGHAFDRDLYYCLNTVYVDLSGE